MMDISAAQSTRRYTERLTVFPVFISHLSFISINEDPFRYPGLQTTERDNGYVPCFGRYILRSCPSHLKTKLSPISSGQSPGRTVSSALRDREPGNTDPSVAIKWNKLLVQLRMHTVCICKILYPIMCDLSIYHLLFRTNLCICTLVFARFLLLASDRPADHTAFLPSLHACA